MVESHPISCQSSSEGECQSFNRLSWHQVLLFFHKNFNAFVFLPTWSKIKFQNIQILHETALRLSLEPQLFLLAMINPTCIMKRIFFFLEKKLETSLQTKSIASFFVGKKNTVWSIWSEEFLPQWLNIHTHTDPSISVNSQMEGSDFRNNCKGRDNSKPRAFWTHVPDCCAVIPKPWEDPAPFKSRDHS